MRGLAACLVAAFFACGDRRAEPSAGRGQGDSASTSSAIEQNTTSGPPAEAAGRVAKGVVKGVVKEVVKEVIDVHVHLTTGSEKTLLEALDRAGIARAVILSTPHLDPALRRAEPGDTESKAGTAGPGLPVDKTSLAGYRRANELVLAAAAAHPDRFLPFVTVDLGETEPDYLAGLLDRGACGVKIYQGHRGFHRRRLDHDSHRAIFDLLAGRGTPILLHINTVRFRDELGALIRAHEGKLNLVCPHFCGSRTDIDRLESILGEFPDLLVDTSHGPGAPGAAGFAHLEEHRDRVRALIEAQPERFLFGSDLVTSRLVGTWAEEWDLQFSGNLGFLGEESFDFWRQPEGQRIQTVLPYRGLALAADTLAKVTRGNAERWLATCLAK